ncbi:3-hydroxyacyl-ACP dehydratase FabZ [candidate division CSSED10-310 bacterium]|uniref:3-hydroxyacyl-[acyl-carrier-protein] dehydratase FabZ n=1 Tax=candidate division CSSED10-310 bacterium TaxID=2855610 RepID=A0ABV6YY27_UNCC1
MEGTSHTAKILESSGIMDLIPHRYPFLLVDKILEYDPAGRIVGLKNVTINEHFFQGHFPGHPIMPGVLIIEAMGQVGAVFIMLSCTTRQKPYLYFRKIERAKFKKPVLPGDCLKLDLTLKKSRGQIWKFEGKSFVNGAVVASAELEAISINQK